MSIKSIPLESHHIELGAKMAPFGGWQMPIQYAEGIIAEHTQTRMQVSLFDCSHMGQFRLRGGSVLEDLDGILPRLASNQKLNSCRYNFLLNENGGILDDIIVYRISNHEFYIVVNGATVESDFEYLKENLSSGTECIDESSFTIKLDLQGPKAAEILMGMGVSKDEIPKYYRFISRDVCEVPCLISRTGYTGELGFEFYFHVDHADHLWNYFKRIELVKPAGLGARDTLRLEMGYPLYGHEMSTTITPVEAGFKRILDLDHDFAGRENLLKVPEKQLTGVLFDSRRGVRQGAKLYDSKDNEVGIVTSGTYSPSLQKSISLAYIYSGDLNLESEIFAKIRSTTIPGKISDLPFYKKGTVRAKL